MIVLVADDLGPIPVTIRSRCQLDPVPAPLGAGGARVPRRARPRALRQRPHRARPRLRRAARPRRAPARARGAGPARRPCSTSRAASTSTRSSSRPAPPGGCSRESRERGEAAREQAERDVDPQAPAREAEQFVKRVARGAEREELLATLDELSAWYRDLVVVAAGADARRGERRPPRRAARGCDHGADARRGARVRARPRGLAVAMKKALPSQSVFQDASDRRAKDGESKLAMSERMVGVERVAGGRVARPQPLAAAGAADGHPLCRRAAHRHHLAPRRRSQHRDVRPGQDVLVVGIACNGAGRI